MVVIIAGLEELVVIEVEDIEERTTGESYHIVKEANLSIMAPKSRNAGKIKLISASSSEASSKSSKKTPQNERDALSSLDDAHIVSLIGIQCDDDEEHFSLVLNYVPGNLEVVLQEMKLEWTGIHNKLLQLAMAIQEISSKDFVLGDIKPDNVLLDKEYNVFVCYFGSARKGGKNIPTVNWHYTARELFINGNGSYPVYIYSFGVILLQMIMMINDFGEVPTKSFVTRPERMSKRKGEVAPVERKKKVTSQ
ncbi:putative receptor-like protein kinase At4g10390 [Primulina tabacum]|uniref:putative receptor-like protein kinase At4g10390 n=1 Tax=Primulina tabacum TaxID=48773 RepID=UPI003F5912EA